MIERCEMTAAKLPANYAAARKALAECRRIDECKKWSAKASALKSYAKQMGDTKLEEDAQRIRNRATQRAGELLLEFEASKGGRPKTASPKGQSFRQQAATDAGLTPKQAKTAVEIAKIEKQLADEMIEASPPASVKQLAAAGLKLGATAPPLANSWQGQPRCGRHVARPLPPQCAGQAR
jgi:hypothetical protein